MSMSDSPAGPPQPDRSTPQPWGDGHLLPERADLAQLRRRAKELRDAVRGGDEAAARRLAEHHPSAAVRPQAVSLAAAQLVIARELGFSSWPKLKAAIDAATQTRRKVSAFVSASVDGRVRQARDMLAADPDIGARSLLAVTVLGDVATVRQAVAVDPAAALAVDDERGWPPLLYACYSRWHQLEPERAVALAEVVRLLLDAGASPNTNDGGRPRFRSALKGAVEVGNPDVVEVLLDAGANPDLGQPIVEAVGNGDRDHRSLRLLLSHGARVARTWVVGAAVHADDAVAVRLLLDALRAAGAGDGGGEELAARTATAELVEAAQTGSLPVVLALLGGGADPRVTDDQGRSAVRLAVRAGRDETAARLSESGAIDDSDAVDRLVGACLNGDRRLVERLLAGDPGLLERLNDRDRSVIVDTAGTKPAETLGLMLELGFSHQARNDVGEQPLHSAAYYGNAAAVRLLLDAGAHVDARDDHFGSTPLAFATVGSGERAGEPGDWLETVRLLVEAGAGRQNVWIAGKPPSGEVSELLQQYGIEPDEPAEADAGQPGHDDGGGDADLGDEADAESGGGVDVVVSGRDGDGGTGVMGEIARHLVAAYGDRDLELLASLLHPEVQWTGECSTSAQVIAWYRTFLTEGTVADVRGVELDRDRIVLSLALSHRAEGARPVPPQERYQVFTVAGDQIVEIRGYPDRRSALARV